MTRPYHFKDRELSKAERAVIIGFWRQSENVLIITAIMELHEETVEKVIQDYFGKKTNK